MRAPVDPSPRFSPWLLRPRLALALLLAGSSPLPARTIGGIELKPGADLRGADLSWEDLQDCDLTGADLRGANCRGTRFGGAVLTGADLRHAQLFEADLSGAVGVDLTGAELQPFFELPHHEAVGDMAFLRTRLPGVPGSGLAPTALACSAGGILLWLSGPGSALRLTTPTGAHFRFTEGVDHLQGIVKDSRERLWCLGADATRVLDLAALDRARSYADMLCPTYSFHLRSAPSGLTAGSAGDIWVTAPPDLFHLRLGERDGLVTLAYVLGQALKLSPRAVGAPVPGTGHVVLVDPEQDRLLFHHQDEEAWYATGLAAGSRARRPVQGWGGRLAFLQTGPAGVGQLDFKANVVRFRALPPLEGARKPWALAMGPDGKLWYTDPGSGRIGRLAADGEHRDFPLPRGLRPLELISGHDGRLFFTVAGRAWIGSIVAVPRVAGAAVPPGAGEAAAGPEPRPERRKPLTRAERHARLDERLQRAERRQQARLEMAARQRAAGPEPKGEGKGGSAADPARAGKGEPGSGPEERKERPDESRPSPLERLAALGVNLTPSVTRHILAGHGHGGNPHKSWFHADFSRREGLEELLARGLEESGAIGRVRVSDCAGRYFTLCTRDGVGWRAAGDGQRVATDRFVVVTARYPVGEGVEHDIITAYPVAGDW